MFLFAEDEDANKNQKEWHSVQLEKDEAFIASLKLNPKEQAFLDSDPIIKIGVRLNKEPFSLADNAKYKGYYVDLLEDLFTGTGIRVAYIPLRTSQASILNKLRGNQLDIVTSLFLGEKTDIQRGGEINRIIDTVVFNQKRGKLNETSFKKLKLVVSRSNNTVSHLRNFPSGEHPRYLNDEKIVFERISTNNLEYTLTNKPIVKYFEQRLGLEDKLSTLPIQQLMPDAEVLKQKISYGYLSSRLIGKLVNKLKQKQTKQRVNAIKDKWLHNYHYESDLSKVDIQFGVEDLNFMNTLTQMNICFDIKNYPFEFKRNDEWVGYNVDLMRLFEKTIGIKLNVTDVGSLKNKREAFLSGNIHFSVFSNQNPPADALRTKHLFQYKHYYVTRYDAPYVNNVEQLKGKRVGIRTGWAKKSVEQYSDVEFFDSYSYKYLLYNVSNGLYDAAIVPSWALSRTIKLDGIHNLQYNARAKEFETTSISTLRLNVNPDYQEFIPIWNKFLSAIDQKQLDDLKLKWFGEHVDQTEKTNSPQEKLMGSFPSLPGLVNEEVKYLQEINELRVGVSPAWMPFGRTMKGEKAEGLIIDIINEFKDYLNLEVVFVNAKSRTEARKLLKEGRVDFYCMALENRQMMSEFNYTAPIGVYDFGVVVKEGFGEANLETLKGKTVGIQEGMPYAKQLREAFPDYKFVNMPTTIDGVNRVSAKSLDAYIDLEPVLNFHIRRKSAPHLVYGMTLPHKQNVSFATNKNSPPELISILNKALKMLPNAERALLKEKWYSLKVEKVTDYTTLYLTLGFTGILTLVFVYWNGKLTRLNQIIKEKELLSRSLLESTNAVPYNFDLTKQAFTYIAPQITKMLGYLPGEFDHVEAWALKIHPDDREKVFDKRNSAIEKGNDYILEYRFKKKNDVYIWMKDMVSVIVERNHPIALRGLLMNVTNEKNQAIAIKAAKEAAESANHSKSQFLANMSHEIRTPLNPIIGLTHLALKTNPDAQIQDYLQKIEVSSKSLLRIINDILDFSKMEANKLSLEKVPFDLEQLNERINSLYGVKAAEKEIDLLFEKENRVHPYIVGDPLRLEQILGNLVSNAIKFTEHGNVTLAIESFGGADNTQSICFMVKDTGAGIPKSKLRKIFEVFTQADDSNTRTHGGTGLGLNICTRLVEMMGGKLEASSEEGVGSKFFFTIPFNCATQEEVEAQTDPSLDKHNIPKFEKRKILLAEDNKINKQVAEELLKAVNLDVIHVNNGRECLKALNNDDYDLVLMDIQMPVMDGFEATREIRKKEKFKDLPIIAMTAHAFASEKEQSKRVGMSSHVTKPVDPIALYNTLRKYIPVIEVMQDQGASSQHQAGMVKEKLLDSVAGVKRLMGNQDIYLNILIEFKNSYLNVSKEIETLLKQKSEAEVAKILHQLKGAAGNVGAILLFESSQEFELAIKESKDCEEELDNFKKVLEQTFLHIDDYLEHFQEEATQVEKSQSAWEELEPMFLKLSQQIQNASPDSLQTVDELEKGVSKEWGESLLEVKINLQNFDFRKAAEKVAQLQKSMTSEVV